MEEDETTDLPSFDEIFSHIPFFGVGGLDLRSIYNEHKDALSELSSFDPLRLAASFGGLLTQPDLQSNCVRIEALVHLAFALGDGNRSPNRKIIGRLFHVLGEGWTGRSEDPAEDVFVSLVASPRGNFRILEGVWEAAGFYTQRLINALESIPEEGPYLTLRNHAHALLALSDAVCERAGLTRNMTGNAVPADRVAPGTLSRLSSIRRLVRFSEQEIADLGIDPDDLLAFGFDPADRQRLMSNRIGHSILERYPVAFRNGQYFLLLPTAVSAALRRLIVEFMESHDLRESFAATLAQEYARTFSSTPFLGGRTGAPVEFKRTDHGALAGVMHQPDAGLFVNVVLYSDTLQNFSEAGLVGLFPDESEKGLGEDINRWIDHAYEAARKFEGFREGITLVVPCGIGRGSIDVVEHKERANWRVEFISIEQLCTLSWIPDFNELSLWRLFEGQQRLAALGVDLQNTNGLLNTVAWARSLGGHLVPHADLPEGFGGNDAHDFLLIDQNSLLKTRQQVAETWDVHVCKDMRGQWVRVRKDGQSLFEEDNVRPFYIAEDDTDTRWPMGVYETPQRSWWIRLETGQETTGYFASERFKMLRTWACLLVPAVEAAFADLPTGALLLSFEFQGNVGDRTAGGQSDFMSLDETLKVVDVQTEGATVTVTLQEGFEQSIRNPTNVAEHALVQRTVEGIADLAGVNLSEAELKILLSEIIPSPDARQSHAFMARDFRDFVRGYLRHPVTKIDNDDAATIKLGLGWRVQDREKGGDITGRRQCTKFLNAIVQILEDEVCSELRRFDRTSMIKIAMLNHERAASDREAWRRTARAVLALHRDKGEAKRVIFENEASLNAVFQASRLLIEFAVCECPVSGGLKPGERDLSRVMARIMMICGMGGWSDAIHWEAMEPVIRITPLGDIHANVTFQENVLDPYGRASTERMVQHTMDGYEKYLVEDEPTETVEREMDAEFWDAFGDEYGCSFDTARKFVDFVENTGLERKKAVFVCKRSELMNAKSEDGDLNAAELEALISSLTLMGRSAWRDVPEGFEAKDIFPWRFRRRLSTLRRPLVEIDNADDDPSMLVAPGLVRDAFAYTITNLYQGDFPASQLSPKMARWAGKAMHQMRSKFSQEVARRMTEFGWETEYEVALTKLLGKGLDADYGDIDVLAWEVSSGRVLLMECKDLQFRKTDGEIAEQLSDFRGELNRDGKPDLLLKHLRRVEVVSKELDRVSKYTGISTPRIEGHLVFKNPVPMKFAWDHMAERISLSLASELDQI
ncbi:hypothetical protein ACLB6G_09455 [Zhengella sp. ZM62]|uniref:hypothetical protein n=1 Tax=Zhengella sedimenti TaxID=3390035 RepID=UPI0039767B8F